MTVGNIFKIFEGGDFKWVFNVDLCQLGGSGENQVGVGYFQSGPKSYFFINISIIQMKSGFNMEQSHKDISQDLIRKILDENESLNKASFPMINEILTAFKISETSMDKNERLKKIKQKLIDIILDEKEEAANYLTLPKFKNLSAESKSTLKEVMTQTWINYQKGAKEDEKNRKYSKYFCRTDNIKQSQEFHLGLYQLIRHCYFYENTPFFRQPLANFGPILGPHGSEHFTGFPALQISNMPQMTHQMAQIGQMAGQMPQMPQQMPQMPLASMAPMSDPYYQMPIENHSHQQVSTIKIEQKDGTNYEHSYSIREQPTPRISKKSLSNDQYAPPAYFNTKNKIQKQSNTIFKAFANCACKGKISETQRYFQCNQCKKRYHLLCLHIPANAIQKLGVQKQCPQCSLKNTNALYSVIGELLQSFWSDDRELHKQKITIKSKKCKQILQKNYSIQIKFLRIDGRYMFDWQGNSSVKEEPNISLTPKKSKLNEVIIKDDVLNKGGGEDVKISLDCMKGSNDKNQDRKPVLLYVALNIVKQKTLSQILSTNYESFQDDYLDRFLKDRQQLKIQIIDTSSKLLNIPARGEDCEHPQLFDLQEFVSHCLDLHTDACFFCSRKCRTFKIDRKVEAQIQKIKNMIPDEDKQPHTIYYQKDGTFRWHTEMLPVRPQKQKMDIERDNDMQEEDSFPSLDVSVSEDEDDDEKSKNKNSKTKNIKKRSD